MIFNFGKKAMLRKQSASSSDGSKQAASFFERASGFLLGAEVEERKGLKHAASEGSSEGSSPKLALLLTEGRKEGLGALLAGQPSARWRENGHFPPRQLGQSLFILANQTTGAIQGALGTSLGGRFQRKSLAQMFASSRGLAHSPTRPLAQGGAEARRQQIEEIYTEEDKHRLQKRRQEFNKHIVIAATSLGFATGGFFYAPLTLVSLSLLLYQSIPIYKKAWGMFKKGHIGVETLTSVTIVGLLAGGYIWIGSLAVFIRLLSRRFLINVTEDSHHKLVDIFRQYPKSVWVMVDGVEVETPFEEVKVGQMVVVNAGETISVDGTIREGMATIDQHILTGESTPVEKDTGSQVFALTVVLSGRIYIEVEKAGEETTAAQIGQLLNNTVDFKANAQLRAEGLADRTVLPTLLMGGIALPTVGPIGALAVLNAHFKYKMSAVAPLSLMNYLNLASQQGILIKDGRSLDLLSLVDTIVFDKTGTLTQEQPHVGAVHASLEYDENTVLMYAAAAEHKQPHPIAKAILEEADQRQLSLPDIEEAEYKLGYGLTVKIEGKLVRVGSIRFMELSGLTIPSELQQVQQSCHAQGHSLVMVAIDDAVAGGIELLPTIRPEAKEVIRQLKQRKNIKEIYIISGDHEGPTKKLAEELGIDHYFAETLPEDKANHIERLKSEGRFICYVGDGINDSIALKASHVSISLRGASSLAVDTAHIILMDEQLTHLVTLFEFADEFQSNTNMSFAIVLIPTLVGIGGVFLLHLGLIHTIMLNLISLGFGIVNGMMPLVKHKLKPTKDKNL